MGSRSATRGTCRCGGELALIASQTWRHADGRTYRHRIEVVERGSPERIDVHKVGDDRGALVMFDDRPYALITPHEHGAVVHYLAVMPRDEQHPSYDAALHAATQPPVAPTPPDSDR